MFPILVCLYSAALVVFPIVAEPKLALIGFTFWVVFYYLMSSTIWPFVHLLTVPFVINPLFFVCLTCSKVKERAFFIPVYTVFQNT